MENSAFKAYKMEMSNKVKISIAGSKYVINTPEEPEYVESLADEINNHIETFTENSGNLSINDALVLTVLNYADGFKKSEQNSDHLRSQLTDYLEDSNRYRNEAEEAKRELEQAKAEIERLKRELGK